MTATRTRTKPTTEQDQGDVADAAAEPEAPAVPAVGSLVEDERFGPGHFLVADVDDERVLLYHLPPSSAFEVGRHAWHTDGPRGDE